MTLPPDIDALNRVLAILRRSFPQYLRYARPYIPAGREDVMAAIERLAASQDALAERIDQTISESGGLPDEGKFPIELTDTHDLSIDFLIRQAIEYQKQDIADLEQCVESLRSAPAAQSLAAEALGMAKAQLETLQELAQRSSSTTSTKIGPTPAFANDVPISPG